MAMTSLTNFICLFVTEYPTSLTTTISLPPHDPLPSYFSILFATGPSDPTPPHVLLPFVRGRTPALLQVTRKARSFNVTEIMLNDSEFDTSGSSGELNSGTT